MKHKKIHQEKMIYSIEKERKKKEKMKERKKERKKEKEEQKKERKAILTRP